MASWKDLNWSLRRTLTTTVYIHCFTASVHKVKFYSILFIPELVYMYTKLTRSHYVNAQRLYSTSLFYLCFLDNKSSSGGRCGAPNGNRDKCLHHSKKILPPRWRLRLWKPKSSWYSQNITFLLTHVIIKIIFGKNKTLGVIFLRYSFLHFLLFSMGCFRCDSWDQVKGKSPKGT